MGCKITNHTKTIGGTRTTLTKEGTSPQTVSNFHNAEKKRKRYRKIKR